MLENNNIICFGTADWDNPYRTNQHNIMERLASKNRILFIESLGLRQPAAQKKDITRILKRLKKGLGGVRKPAENIFVFSPLVLPFHRFKSVRALNNTILKNKLRSIIKKYGFNDSLIWTYVPAVADTIGALESRMVIYHCVDELSANPLIPDILRKIEEDFIRDNADLVFVTSKSLYDSKSGFSNAVHYLPNVADFKHFNKAISGSGRVPQDIKDIKRPVAGFIGAVSEYKLDIELIKHVAEKMTDVSFVFIGPSGEGEKAVDPNNVIDMENVHFLGPKPFEKLPDYLREFNICLLPNRINEYTRNMFPLKFFEYLSAGKPVISTDLPALREFSNYYYTASGGDDFIDKIKKALDEDNREKINSRIDLASRYTWEKRVEEMSEIIRNAR
ncbi:glycosyltransferase [Elusimicrobiota bacterium]